MSKGTYFQCDHCGKVRQHYGLSSVINVEENELWLWLPEGWLALDFNSEFDEATIKAEVCGLECARGMIDQWIEDEREYRTQYKMPI